MKFGVQVGVDVHLADVVKEVEIEVVHLAFFQLLVENFLYLVHVGQVVAGEFGGQVKALPGIIPEQPAHNRLGLPPVVAPSGIIVVDPPGHSRGHHLAGGGFVDVGVLSLHNRQAHGAHPQGGKA